MNHERLSGLAKEFPAFMWVLRDFALRLEDSNGKQISSDQYLEEVRITQAYLTEVVGQFHTVYDHVL